MVQIETEATLDILAKDLISKGPLDLLNSTAPTNS
jgi:hypothetical protein